jgi:hypothetical protein
VEEEEARADNSQNGTDAEENEVNDDGENPDDGDASDGENPDVGDADNTESMDEEEDIPYDDPRFDPQEGPSSNSILYFESRLFKEEKIPEFSDSVTDSDSPLKLEKPIDSDSAIAPSSSVIFESTNVSDSATIFDSATISDSATKLDIAEWRVGRSAGTPPSPPPVFALAKPAKREWAEGRPTQYAEIGSHADKGLSCPKAITSLPGGGVTSENTPTQAPNKNYKPTLKKGKRVGFKSFLTKFFTPED